MSLGRQRSLDHFLARCWRTLVVPDLMFSLVALAVLLLQLPKEAHRLPTLSPSLLGILFGNGAANPKTVLTPLLFLTCLFSTELLFRLLLGLSFRCKYRLAPNHLHLRWLLPPGLALTATLWLAAALLNGGVDMNFNHDGQAPLFFTSALSGAVMLFFVVLILQQNAGFAAIATCLGANSLVILATQPFWPSLSRQLFAWLASFVPQPLIPLISSLAGHANDLAGATCASVPSRSAPRSDGRAWVRQPRGRVAIGSSTEGSPGLSWAVQVRRRDG